MKLVFRDLGTKTDKDKAIPVLEHIFSPLPDNPEVKVRCTYLKPGESMGYMSTAPDGRTVMDFRTLFAAQVKAIEGLEVEYGDGVSMRIASPLELLELPAVGQVSEILTRTCTHLITADALTEEEVKN